MISLNNTLTAIMDKFKSIDEADTGVRTKVITKTLNWGLAALVRSGNLEFISGAEWNNCKVKVVISYVGGGKAL